MTEEERNAYLAYINEQYDLLITRIAEEILNGNASVDDVKQKVLLKMAPKAQKLASMHPKQLTSYLATTTRNVAYSVYKKNAIYEGYMEQYVDDYKRSMTMDYVEFKAFQNNYGFSDDLWSLMQELPELDRNILVYRFHYQMTSGEIAEIIGTNREHVKKRFQRTQKKLVKLIEERGLELR